MCCCRECKRAHHVRRVIRTGGRVGGSWSRRFDVGPMAPELSSSTRTGGEGFASMAPVIDFFAAALLNADLVFLTSECSVSVVALSGLLMIEFLMFL